MSIDPKVAANVLDRIEEAALVELALHISNIESPRGAEGECAEAIYQWCVEEGFPAQRVGMFEDRLQEGVFGGGSGGAKHEEIIRA